MTAHRSPAETGPRAAVRTSLRVETVRPEMFELIYQTLLRKLNPRHPVDEFRRIFTHPWRADDEGVGLALFDDGRPVAFVGLIFSRMEVAGRTERLCNVTSLIADETHRAEAAMLLLRLRSMSDCTVTNLTCNDAAYRVFTRLGYAVLDDSRTVFYPRWRPGQHRVWRVEHDVARVRTFLSAADARVLDDHLAFAGHLLVHAGEASCYVVYTIGRRRLLPSARLHYVSDPKTLAMSWPAVQRSLWRRHRAVFAECDTRLLDGVTVPWSRRRRLTIPRLYRSTRLEPRQISNLYSEMILLNLA